MDDDNLDPNRLLCLKIIRAKSPHAETWPRCARPRGHPGPCATFNPETFVE